MYFIFKSHLVDFRLCGVILRSKFSDKSSIFRKKFSDKSSKIAGLIFIRVNYRPVHVS